MGDEEKQTQTKTKSIAEKVTIITGIIAIIGSVFAGMAYLDSKHASAGEVVDLQIKIRKQYLELEIEDLRDRAEFYSTQPNRNKAIEKIEKRVDRLQERLEDYDDIILEKPSGE